MTGTLEFDRSLDTIFKIDPDSGTISEINLFRGGNSNPTYLDNRLLGATYRNVLRWVGGAGASTEIMRMPSDASGVTINRLIVSGQTQLNAELTVDADVTISNDGNLQVDSGNITATFGDITTNNGNIKASQGHVQTNLLKSVGNSNIQVQRNDERKMLWGTNNIIADKKIKYNTSYDRGSYTSDLVGVDSYTLMPKWYIDSAVENASFVFDSSQFVNVTGDAMTGELSISRSSEHNVALRIKKGTQERLHLRSDGKINWTADATNAVLNKDGGDLSISIDDDLFMKFDQTQGDVEVAKTITLTGSEKAINLPNNSDTGQLQSNGNRRLYWDKDDVGIDVPLQMSNEIRLNTARDGVNYTPANATSRIIFENTKTDGTKNSAQIFQNGAENTLVTTGKFKTKANFYTNEYLYGWKGTDEYVYSPRVRLQKFTGTLVYNTSALLLWNEYGVRIPKSRGDGADGSGIIINGAIGDDYSATTVTEQSGVLLQLYHNPNATDEINYYGRITSDNNIVTKEYVDYKVARIFPSYVGVDYSSALDDRIDSALDGFTAPAPSNVIINDGSTQATTAFKILGDGKTFIQNSDNELGLYNLRAPTDTHHATRKAYVDDNFVALTGDQSVGGYKTFTSEGRFTQSLKVDKSGSANNAVLRRDTIEAMIAAAGGGDYKITKSGGNYYIEST